MSRVFFYDEKYKNKVILNLFQDLICFLEQNKAEMLKPIYQTPYYNLTGRGQAVKAAIQHDII